jgi:ABC-type multidrug transport system ATPase subunit
MGTDDVHFPTLTVSQTMQFAASTKLIASRPEGLAQSQVYADHIRDEILSDLGISHTHSTMVGNEYIRGISGGERKRVSLAETMATQVRTIEARFNVY